jgi:8-oxo-dGTP diphosphatase
VPGSPRAGRPRKKRGSRSVRSAGITEQLIEADRQHWISLLYVTEDTSGDPQLTEPDKLSEIGWFDLDDLPQPLSVFTQTVLTYLR